MAKTLSDLIAAQGGLTNASGLAERWGISTAAVSALTARSDFPEPVDHIGKSPVWSIQEADRWRERMPRKKPQSDSSSMPGLQR